MAECSLTTKQPTRMGAQLLPIDHFHYSDAYFHVSIIFDSIDDHCKFSLIRQVDPSALTLGSCLVLVYALADLWGASLLRVTCQNGEG